MSFACGSVKDTGIGRRFAFVLHHEPSKSKPHEGDDMPELPEIAFPLDKLLSEITLAFVDASQDLRDRFDAGGALETAPFAYHMPRMTCEIKLTFSFTRDGVKGVFSKSKTREEQEIVSTMHVEVVAAPKVVA